MDITAVNSAATIAGGSSAQTSNVDKLANKETFLQLLVAQIRNQDPLKPADGVQFLTQLAQFSELEQLIAIRSELKTMAVAPETAPVSQA